MNTDSKEQWCVEVINKLDEFIEKYNESIDKHQQQVKACKKKNELEMKLAQEIKLNNELTEQLAELSRRSTEIDRVCATLQSRLTIGDNDKKRLENARDTNDVLKKLTGIRFDYTAPPNVAKGYIKNENRKVLQPFEIDMNTGDCSEALWSTIQSTVMPDWLAVNETTNKK